MKVLTNELTLTEVKKIIDAQVDQPSNVRIYIAGMGWGGPSFGLALDELKEEDVNYTEGGVTFVMEEFVYDQYGDFNVEFVGGGYRVAPSDQEESDCGSCSGSCDH